MAPNIRLTISANTDFEHLAYQTDRIYTIEVAPISKEEEEKKKKAKFGFTGERLSLNFQDIEVRSVLQLLADFTGLNLVVSDSVEGNLTLRLKNVPWDQAMDIILKTKGLDQRRAGNVILIAPTDEIAAREKLELEARKQVEELERLRTEFIKVNYAKAADIAELLNLKDNAILSPRGSVSVDERTNTLLVKGHQLQPGKCSYLALRTGYTGAPGIDRVAGGNRQRRFQQGTGCAIWYQ